MYEKNTACGIFWKGKTKEVECRSCNHGRRTTAGVGFFTASLVYDSDGVLFFFAAWGRLELSGVLRCADFELSIIRERKDIPPQMVLDERGDYGRFPENCYQYLGMSDQDVLLTSGGASCACIFMVCCEVVPYEVSAVGNEVYTFEYRCISSVLFAFVVV